MPASRPRLRPLVLALCALGGCALPSGGRSKDPLSAAESPSQAAALQSELIDYVDLYSARVAGTADDIAAASGDRSARELTLRWKLRAIPSMRVAAAHRDPRRAFLDAWFLTVRLRVYFTEGAGGELLGAQRELAARTMRELEARIEALGRSLLGADDFAEAERELDALAAGQAMGGRFAADIGRASSEVTAAQHPGLFGLLSIPLGGLKEGAEAVNRLAHTAGLASQVLAALPEESRWQLELALLEAQQLEEEDLFLRELGRLRASVDGIAATAAALPAEVRSELETALGASEGPLRELGATLEKLDATVASTDALAGRAGLLLTELREVAVAWRATATEVNAVMEAIGALSGGAGGEASSGEEGGWSFRELARAGDSVGAGATELRALLDELESERLEARAAALTGAADGPIQRGADELRALLDRAAWIAAVLGAVLLAGLHLVLRASRALPRR